MWPEDLLLISSDPLTINTVKEVTEDLNIAIKVKKNIRTGVKVSKNSQIVLIDYLLQDGDCLDCLQNLKVLNSNLYPIIFVEDRDKEKRRDVLLSDALFYIIKPIMKDELKAILERTVEIKKLKRENEKLLSCSIEEFLKDKLKGYIYQIKKIGDIGIYDTVISEVEKALLKLAIEETKGSKLKASQLLGLNRNTVRNKLKKYKINLL